MTRFPFWVELFYKSLNTHSSPAAPDFEMLTTDATTLACLRLAAIGCQLYNAQLPIETELEMLLFLCLLFGSVCRCSSLCLSILSSST